MPTTVGRPQANWPHATQGQTELVTACERTKGARALREETPRASRDQAMTRGTELRRARSATRAAHTTRAHSRAQSIQEDRPPAVLAFARLVSFCINRVGLSARRRRRRHQVGRHQIDNRRWHRLVRCRRIDVGNLPELPAAAALLCGCRSWLPAATALGSSSVVTSSATGCCWLCCCLSSASRLREVLACAGATSFWVAGPTGPISTTPSTSVRVRCPWGMYSLKPVRRGGMMNSRPLARRCHSCVPEKWYLSQI